MARVTLDILGRTIFSDGLGRDLDRFAAAINGISRPLAGSIPSIFSIFPNGRCA
jgi:hypothetical protein